MPSDRFYNTLAFLYPLVDIFLQRQKRLLFAHINRLPAGKLLEIGVGNGTHLGLYGKHNVTAIDTSAGMLKIARKYAGVNIELLQMDGQRLLFNNEHFDYVVLSHVIAVVDDPDQMMDEVVRVLKPKGQLLILNHFTPNNLVRFVDHAFQPLSKVLHLRSVFYAHQIPGINRLKFVKEQTLGLLAYFKLLVYQKP